MSGLFDLTPQEAAVEAVLTEVGHGGRLNYWDAKKRLADPLAQSGLIADEDAGAFAQWLGGGVPQDVVHEFLLFLQGIYPKPTLPITPDSMRSSRLFTHLLSGLAVAYEGRLGTNHWAYDHVFQTVDSMFGTGHAIADIDRVAGQPFGFDRSDPTGARLQALDRLTAAKAALDGFAAAHAATPAARPLSECHVGWRVSWIGRKGQVEHGTCVRREDRGEDHPGEFHLLAVADTPIETSEPPIWSRPTRAWHTDPEWRELFCVYAPSFYHNAWTATYEDRVAFCEEAHPEVLPLFGDDRLRRLIERSLRAQVREDVDLFDAAREMAQAATGDIWETSSADIADRALCAVIADDPAGALARHLAVGRTPRYLRDKAVLLRHFAEALAAVHEVAEVESMVRQACFEETFERPDGQTLEHCTISEYHGYNWHATLLGVAASENPVLIQAALSFSSSIPKERADGRQSWGQLVHKMNGRTAIYLPGETVPTVTESSPAGEEDDDTDQDDLDAEVCACDLDDDDLDDDLDEAEECELEGVMADAQA